MPDDRHTEVSLAKTDGTYYISFSTNMYDTDKCDKGYIFQASGDSQIGDRRSYLADIYATPSNTGDVINCCDCSSFFFPNVG